MERTAFRIIAVERARTIMAWLDGDKAMRSVFLALMSFCVSTQLHAACSELKIEADIQACSAAFSAATRAAPSNDFKLVDAEDLASTPSKFLDKRILIKNMHCLHSIGPGFRCTTGNTAVTFSLFVDEVRPNQDLLKNCERIKDVPKINCARDMKFVPLYISRDHGGDRTIIFSDTAEAILADSRDSRRGHKED